MKHLGDITKINGAEVPTVNVIIGGSPCQDLSVAGKREGLKGDRSGLFMEQLRIIKEMRDKSVQDGSTVIRPRYMVWENVPGAFSSNKGQDFKTVLEETIKIVKKDCPDIPVPDGGWHYSGCIVGNQFSVAWRVFDARFWGVPQRRRRIALVADFGGTTAPEILFERESVSRDITQSGTPWQDFAAVVAKRFNSADRKSTGAGIAYSFDSLSSNSMKSSNPNSGCRKVDVAKTLDTTIPDPSKNQGGICILNDQGGSVMDVKENADVSPTLRSETHGHAPICFDARGNGDGETVPTITGDHENRVTDYTALAVGFPLGFRPENVRTYDETASTLCNGTRAGFCNGVIALDRASFNQGKNAQYDFEVTDSGINSTLTAKGPGAVCESVVRRLTPLECERLQGFPDGWTDIGEYIDTTGKKRKTSDSARYKALGNSIALPPWAWILERISKHCGDNKTMASLFDGIGGFPLIWETINGEGTCLWASEIEEFPIAVTKYHFKE